MGRRGWWYEVSRDEYEETKKSYGSDIYALDTRLKGSTEDKQSTSSKTRRNSNNQHQQVFSQSRVFIEPPAKGQALYSSKKNNSVTNKRNKIATAKPVARPTRVSGAEDRKAYLTNPGSGEVVHAIKQKISELKAIIESSEKLLIKRTSFGKTLEELRGIFRNSKVSFSSSDIENIQGLKEQFEKAVLHHN
jgi:hypothetical protein